MKKFTLLCGALLLAAGTLCAAEAADKTAEKAVSQPAVQEQTKAVKLSPAEQKKAFEKRQKLIKKLVKQYRKAPAAQQPAIKAQLAQVVSESVDAGMAYVKQRIADERANLDNWEAKMKENEQNLDQIKARRVEELLSPEAERKHKAAQTAWKKQMKQAEKQMR